MRLCVSVCRCVQPIKVLLVALLPNRHSQAPNRCCWGAKWEIPKIPLFPWGSFSSSNAFFRPTHTHTYLLKGVSFVYPISESARLRKKGACYKKPCWLEIHTRPQGGDGTELLKNRDPLSQASASHFLGCAKQQSANGYKPSCRKAAQCLEVRF